MIERLVDSYKNVIETQHMFSTSYVKVQGSTAINNNLFFHPYLSHLLKTFIHALTLSLHHYLHHHSQHLMALLFSPPSSKV